MFTEKQLIKMQDPSRDGYVAHLAAQGSRYDVIAEIRDRLLRIQVKTTVYERDHTTGDRSSCFGYSWFVRRTGKGGRTRLRDSEVDLIALVALDGPYIAYLEPEYCGQTVQMSSPRRPVAWAKSGTPMRKVDAFPFSRFIEDMK